MVFPIQKGSLTMTLPKGIPNFLAAETDPEIFYSDLLDYAHDLRRDQDPAAHALYRQIAEEGSGSVREQALAYAGALEGRGDGGLRLEMLAGNFLEEATRPATIAGMAAGQLVYATSRFAVLSRLWNPASRNFTFGAWGARGAAAGLGLLAEVPTFWGVSKGLQETLHPGSQSWDGSTNFRELASLGLTLAVLRGTGFASQAALNWARPSVVTQKILPPTAAIGGLFLAQTAEETVDLKKPRDGASRLFDSVITYFQFSITGRLSQGLLGRQFQQWNQHMEQELYERQRLRLFTDLDFSFPFGLQVAMASGPKDLPKLSSPSREGPITQRPAMMSRGNPTDSTSRPLHVQDFTDSVLKRGRNDELFHLKTLVGEVYRDCFGRDPIENVRRYLDSPDSEAWKTGVRILVSGESKSAGKLREALASEPAFLEFVKKWQSRSHFIKVEEIPLYRAPGYFADQVGKKFLAKLLGELVRSPDRQGISEFIRFVGIKVREAEKRGRPIPYQWETLNLDDRRSVHWGNIGKLGLGIPLASNEVFRGPLYLRPAFSEADFTLFRGRLQQGESFEAIQESLIRAKRFKHFSEVTVELLPGTQGGFQFDQLVNKVQEFLAEDPNMEGVRKILKRYKGTEANLRELELREGGKIVVFNRGSVGVVLKLDGEGEMVLPLRVGNKFTPEPLDRFLSSYQTVGEAKVAPERVLEENPLSPLSGENSEAYAARFLLESRRRESDHQLQLVLTLEAMLRDPEQEGFARQVVDQIKIRTQKGPEGESAVVREYTLPGLQEPLTIFSPITTFLPENWSRFFARQVLEEIKRGGGRVARAAELGSGTGWLSLYLRKLGVVDYMEGGDLTETAPVVSRINALLNGVEEVRFVKSNLWENLSREEPFDLVVACIPQIPKELGTITERGFADYAPARENIFKPYGLGLVYEALNQSRTHLSEQGRILLNLAGRPGLGTLLEMYRRAGYHPILRQHDIIEQDPNTDIGPLAQLEASFPGVRFKFLPPIGEGDQASLSATDVVALRVESAVGMRHHQFLIEGRPYLNFWRGALGPREGIAAKAHWGYTAEAGAEYPPLRQFLAEQWGREWGVPVSQDSLFLGPRWEQLTVNLLTIQVPSGGKILWFGGAPREVRRLKSQFPEYRHKSISSLPELQLGLQDGKVDAAVLQLPRHHWVNPDLLLNHLQQTVEREIPVVLVEPFGVREGSEPNPVLERMSLEPAWRRQITLVQPLEQRFALEEAGVPLSVALVGDPGLYRQLARLGDITYSRTSTAAQEVYYHMLLGLQVDPLRVEQRLLTQGTPLEPLSESIPSQTPLGQLLETDVAFNASPTGESRRSPVIELNFGQSEWQAPVDLRPAWLRVRLGISPQEIRERATDSVVQYLGESRGIEAEPEQIVLGQGVHPLLQATLTSYGNRSAHPVEVWVPQGSYGKYFPTVSAAGVSLRLLNTEAENDFKVRPGYLAKVLQGPTLAPRSRPLLLINTPSNPAGRYYSPEELLEIADILKSHRGALLLDDVFGMLDTRRIPNQGSDYLAPLLREFPKQSVVFGGLSKEFGAGGLRMGWAVVSNKSQAEAVQKFTYPPDTLSLSATPEFLGRWKTLVPQHQNYLAGNRRLLAEFLDSRNISYHPSEGGYALLVDLNPFFRNGRVFRRNGDGETRLNPENFHEVLYREAGLKVHAPEFSRTPGRYRMVYAIDNIEEAISRLKQFFRNTR
jgi:aspartate/methionine/tyrosine aminotransferase